MSGKNKGKTINTGKNDARRVPDTLWQVVGKSGSEMAGQRVPRGRATAVAALRHLGAVAPNGAYARTTEQLFNTFSTNVL
jgi:hypothetical protein